MIARFGLTITGAYCTHSLGENRLDGVCLSIRVHLLPMLLLSSVVLSVKTSSLSRTANLGNAPNSPAGVLR